MTDHEIKERVQKKIKARKGFMAHLGVYLATGLFFLVINLVTMGGTDELWFYWPMIPWGLGLLIHYFGVFGLPGTQELVEKWELEETAREMKRMRKQDLKQLDAGAHEDELELKDLKKEPQKSRYDNKDFV